MPDFAPTSEQEQILSVAPSADSMMIGALAGTGKSSTLEMLAPRIRQPALALAFNVGIAKALDQRLPAHFTARTLNSLGHGAWIRANPQVLAWEKPDTRKLGKIASELVKAEKRPWLWEDLMTATRAGMNAGLLPDSSEGLVPDELEAWRRIAPEIDEDDLEEIVELARETLRRSIQMARAGKISFDDQIYCSALLGGQFPKYPVIFGDEVQDWSPLNLRMIERTLRVSGRLVLVGDQNQSIYLFRGADPESMTKARRLALAWTDLPLTMTFRCPRLIVERQHWHVPTYRAFAGNREGRFESWQEWGPRRLREAGYPTILCRNTGPLLWLAFRLLGAGVGCSVAGRDIGRSLIALSRKISKDDEQVASSVMKAIVEWRGKQIELAIASDQIERVESISDRSEALQAVLESSGAQTAGDLRRLLEQLFAREGGLVRLSTIHRAKGLEYDGVLHLDPWRLPSKWARRAGGPVLAQEWNLKYVCETRTREALFEADMRGWRGA